LYNIYEKDFEKDLYYYQYTVHCSKEMEQQGTTHLIIETDSENVVDSEFSTVIVTLETFYLFFLTTKTFYFVVKFIKRQTNMIVHTLARAAMLWFSRHTFYLLPCCISSLT
jgi:hypothetical protein